MEQQVTINEFVVKFIDEMRKIGYSEEGICREHYRTARSFARYYERSKVLYYSIETTTEYLNLTKTRAERGEIGSGQLKKIRIMAKKMNEFFITGHLSLRGTKRGTVYEISAENERLIDCFIDWKKYGTNTCDDVWWVVRKYLYYLERLGHVTLENVTIDEVRDEKIISVEKYAFKKEMVDGKDFFRLKDDTIPIFVSETVKEIVENNKLLGFDFWEIPTF